MKKIIHSLTRSNFHNLFAKKIKYRDILNWKHFIIILTTILIVSCKRDQAPDIIVPIKVETYKCVYPDTNGVVLANIGDTIVLKIYNPSYDSGYRWYHTIDFNPTIASFIDYNYIFIAPNPGAAANEIWRYRAKQNGTDKIFFELYRPWVIPREVIGTKSFYLTVM